MRVQLSLWYTGVLALVLIIFALIAYSYLARSIRQRTDEALSDTANSFISTLASELNDENQTAQESVNETTRSFHFRDRQVIVFDQFHRQLAASDPPENIPLGSPWLDSRQLKTELDSLVTAVPKGDGLLANLDGGNYPVRILAINVSQPSSYTIVIASPLVEQTQVLSQARTALYIAIPLAIMLASLGGYFLAQKSLAPVVIMGEQAARIGASNLNERIPVSRNNNEMERLATIFNDLLERLDKSFAQQRRFMADASHEMRTPVAVICGESEVALSKSRSSEEYRDSLSIVNDEGKRLTRMVEDLFLLARADAGASPLVVGDFYLDETLNESVRSIRSLAAQQELQLAYEPPGHEMPFRGDEPLIRRMILNLLHNAIKYTPRKGRISIDVLGGSKDYKIIVTDSGTGIPVEAHEQVFERFFRVDKARSREGFLNGSGAGLGLSIAKWAAESHGGSIALERSDESGTTFVVSLPCAN